MIYNLNGKNIQIPNKELDRIKNGLHISAEEAAIIWLEDEGKIINQEQEELDKKAKKAGISNRGFAYSPDKQKTQQQRVKKENPTKEMIITEIAKKLQTIANNVEIVNAGKLITFELNGKKFKFDLVQQREKK